MTGVLVDTSIWISHFRKGETHVQKLLQDGSVLCHSFVMGELACGNLGNRDEILSFLERLPQAPKAEDAEVLRFIERNRLVGSGLGWVDVNLLASAMLAKAELWTMDKHLRKASGQLDILYDC